MQRKFLEEMGLEKEAIDKIMSENGADIERTKTAATDQIAALEEQLTTAKDALKSFDGVDVGELQGKIMALTNDLAGKENEYKEKLADMEFSTALDGAISSGGGRDSKAVKAFLDMESLRKSKNQSEDIKAAVAAVKTEKDYLFSSDEPIKNAVKSTGSPAALGENSVLRTAMGLPAKTE